MSRIIGFPPLATRDARILILGSMPGHASLDAKQYYAHPHNAFWSIMDALAGACPSLSYRARTLALKATGIALWDVLASCEREGSLDADIRHESVVVNDFNAFFATHPKITNVFFNGGMAETCFRRYALPTLGHNGLRFMRLPSTSPANASMSRADKLEAWRQALQGCGGIQTEHSGN